MPVTLFAYECLTAVYGESFARAWFRPVSPIRRNPR